MSEQSNQAGTVAWEAFRERIKFDDQGLIPAIAQQHDTGEVLMMAWMNRESLDETLDTGRVCYWSRSRGRLWRKGETSGQVQRLVELRVDCDADTLLLLVDQTGPACHTGRRSCFYHAVRDGQVEIISEPLIDPDELYSS
ncbi:MAG: phosphoribosyl-AMP cyclohydrolase [Gammaproteobacteria bacterium]|jgi:phosphoribosyl-AMP cyclohydrolase